MSNKKNKLGSFFESLVIIMIVLVLVQTFLEDFLVVIDYKITYINLVKLSAFIFDAFFTIEFITRMWIAVDRKKGKEYFFHKNGWIDLLASLPLLLFVSGPYFLEYMFSVSLSSIAVLNAVGMVKLIKAIRVTRVLRLLRVLKIFGKIKNTESFMAQRHISIISTIVVGTMIVFIFVSAIVNSNTKMVLAEEAVSNKENAIITDVLSSLAKWDFAAFSDKAYGSVIYVKKDESMLLYNSKTPETTMVKLLSLKSEYLKEYKPEEGVSVVFSRNNILALESRENLTHFFLIIVVIISIVFFYSRYFAQMVTDPIYVMRNGFNKLDYTFTVRVPKYHEEDDIFKLAMDYNSKWLPAKMRKLDKMKVKESKISFSDIFGENPHHGDVNETR